MTLTINIRNYNGVVLGTEKYQGSKTAKKMRFVYSTNHFVFCLYDANNTKLYVSTNKYFYSSLMDVDATEYNDWYFMGMSYGLNSRFADAFRNSTNNSGVPRADYSTTEFGSLLSYTTDTTIDLFASKQIRTNFNVNESGVAIYLGVTTDNPNVVSKDVSYRTVNDKKTPYYCTFVDGCSKFNPRFTIYSGGGAFNYNYVEIPKFNRFYFIDDIIYGKNNLVTFVCSVDVLMSHINAIKNSIIAIDRCQYGYDTKLHDSTIPVETNATVEFFTASGVNNTIFNKASSDDESIITIGEFSGV